MSRFILQNESGQAWPLDGERGVWLSNVQGLGIQNVNNVADLGGGFSKWLDTGTYPMVSVPGDLIFMPPNAYQTYRSFVDFALSSDELLLLYKPFGEDTFYRRVKIEYINKGVTDKRGRLDCPMSTIPLTPWYSPRVTYLVLQEQSEDAMTYDFEYTESLTYGSDLAGSYAAEVTPAGHIPAAVRLTYSGTLSNPVLSLVGSNSGTEYARCEVETEVNGLDYSSLQRDSYVRDGDGDDLLGYVDMDSDPYIRIPIGEPCVLRLQADGTISGGADVSIYSYYRSV